MWNLNEHINDATWRALRVCREIDEWLEKYTEAGLQACAVLTLTKTTLEIQIGQILLWDSENHYVDESIDSDQELTAALCLQTYRKCLDDLLDPFKRFAISAGE